MENIRANLLFIVKARAAGAPPAQPHTHIECFCYDHIHRRDDYDDGCFCPACASKAAVALGYPPTDITEDVETPWDGDDLPRWCETCGVLISTLITPDGALEELDEYERRPRTSPEEWRDFALCVENIADEYLPRVEAVVERCTPDAMAIGAAERKRKIRAGKVLAQFARTTKPNAAALSPK